MMSRIVLIAFLLISTVSAKTLVFGVVPQQGPIKMTKKWAPVTTHLKKTTGLDIQFKTEKSIPTFEKELYAGKYDIVYMNPYHYVVASHAQKYDAMIRADKLIVGILLVNKDKGVTDLKDIKGKTLLFPAPFAFAATLLTKYELQSRFGIDVENETTVRYVNSHDSVYKGVARGIGQVGGGIVRTFNNLADTASKDKIKIIHKTEQYPSHPIATLPSVSPEERQKIEQALLALPADVLKALSIKVMIKTDDKEYDIVRALAKELKIMPE